MTLRERGIWSAQAREGEGQAWELMFFNSTLQTVMYEIDSIKLYFTL